MQSANATSSSSPEVLQVEPLPLLLAIPTLIALSLLVFGTIFGNALVIAAIKTQKALQQPQNNFMISLAFADMFMGFFVMTPAILYEISQYWPFNKVLCSVWITVDVLFCTSSILNLCAIALDRYLAISRPIWYAGKRSVKFVITVIMCVWILSCLISIPPLFGWDDLSYQPADGILGEGYRSCDYASQRVYVIYSALGSYFIPFAFMVFVYIQIYRVAKFRIKKNKRLFNNLRLSSKRRSHVNTRQKNGVEPTAKDHDNKNMEELNGAMSYKALTKNEADSTPVATVKLMNDSNPLVTNHTQSAEKNEIEKISPEKEDSGSRGDLTSKGAKSKKMAVVSIACTVTSKPPGSKRISIPREKKAAIVLGIIMGLFILCWMPFFLMYVIVPFCSSCSYPSPKIYAFIVWLGYCNSTMNPIVYTIFNEDFRSAFAKMLTLQKRPSYSSA